MQYSTELKQQKYKSEVFVLENIHNLILKQMTVGCSF